jgi:hypothetical protein
MMPARSPCRKGPFTYDKLASSNGSTAGMTGWRRAVGLVAAAVVVVGALIGLVLALQP